MGNVVLNEESTKSTTIRSSSIEFGLTYRGNNQFNKQTDFVNINLISLVAETNRTVNNSNLLRNIINLWVFLQILFGSFLMCLPRAIGPEWVHKFSQIMLLFSYGENNVVLQFLHVILQGITILVSIIIIVDYSLHHKFRKWELYTMRFWHCQIYNILIIPNLISTINSFATYGLEPSVVHGVSLVLNIIVTTYCIFHTFRFTLPLEQNPFLTHYSILYWRPIIIYKAYLIYGAIFSTCTLNRLYSTHARYIPLILFILNLIYNWFYFNDFPYDKLIINTIFHTIPFVGAFSSILYVFFDQLDLDNSYLYFFSIIGLSIVVGIFMYIHHYLKTKHFKENLFPNFKQDENSSDNNKKEYLDSLNMSLSDAFYYLQLGVATGSPLFIDWSLSNYIIEKFSDHSEILVFLTWLVSFFPSETHILHGYITIGLKMLSSNNFFQCFFYQLHRVHIFRQSSASSESTSDLSNIKKLTKTCIGMISWYWFMVATDPSQITPETLHIISDKIIKVDTTWDELLEKYPNNAVFISLYSIYLLDVKSSFKSAARWHEKSVMIEAGTHLHNDKLFRGFLQMYPFYLKQKIVDTHGHIITSKTASKINKNYKAAMSTSSFTSSTGNEDDDSLNFEEASNFIPNFKLRIALERPIKTLPSPLIQTITLWSVLRLILNIIFIILIYKSIVDLFPPIEDLSYHIRNLNALSHPLKLLSHEIIWFYATSFPEVSNATTMLQLYQATFGDSANEIEYYLNVSYPMNDTIFQLSKDSMYYLDKYASALYISNNLDDPVLITLSDILSLYKVTDTVCKRNNTIVKIEYENSTSLDFILKSYSTNSLKMSNDTAEERENWSNTTEFCELFLHPWGIQEGLTSMVNYLMEVIPTIYGSSGEEVQTSEFILSFIPFIGLLIIFPNILLITFSLEEEKKKLTGLILAVNPESALEASQSLFKGSQERSQKVSSFHYLGHSINYNLLFNLLSVVVICGLMMVNAGLAYNRQSLFSLLFEHYLITFSQRDAIFDIGRDAACLVLVNHIETLGLRTRFLVSFNSDSSEILEEWNSLNYFPFTTIAEVKSHLFQNLIRIQDIIEVIEHGNEYFGGIVGNFEEIDDFRHAEKCKVAERTSSPLIFTKCISFDRLIQYFTTMANNIYLKYDELYLNSTDLRHLANLIESRLGTEFHELMNSYEQIFDKYLSEFETLSLILLIIEIILVIIIFFVEVSFIFAIEREYKVFKSLVLRLNPISVVSDHLLLSWIFGNDTNSEKNIKTPAQAVFQTSSDAMLFMSADYIIESANSSVTTLFGFTNEQIIGQSINILLNPDNNSRLFYVMKMMISGQSEMIFEDNALGVRDNSTNIRLKVELIGIPGDDKRAKGFILLLKDMTEELLQIEAVESARRRTEEIMLQILPKNIITRLFKKQDDAPEPEKEANLELNLSIPNFNNRSSIFNTSSLLNTNQNPNLDLSNFSRCNSIQRMISEDIFYIPENDNDEIAFTVKIATPICINIDNFTSYAASLSPADVLNNLSKVFSYFDKLASSYSHITVIRSISDTYLAAGGIFDKGSDKAAHATQVVQFASAALLGIEELNISLNANLQIRIGITTDGPLVAGMLGKDKPLFDIYGNPISNAMELEKACVPGEILMSQYTYQLINKEDFKIEPRGTKELKNRGEVKVYAIIMEDIGENPKESSANNVTFNFNLSHLGLDAPPPTQNPNFNFSLKNLF